MVGHALAIRSVAASPHVAGAFASCAYDRLTCVWRSPRRSAAAAVDARTTLLGPFACGPPTHAYRGHTEFTTACDFDLEHPRLADCSWDCTVAVYPLVAS